MSILLILLLVFLGSLLLAISLLTTFFPAKSVLKDQLEIYERARKKSPPEDKNRKKSLFEKKLLFKPFFNLVSALAEKRGLIEDFQLKLDRAGLPLRASEFVFLHLSGTVFLGLLGYLLSESFALAIFLVGVGVLFPLFLMGLFKKRRETRFHGQLPDTLTLIAGALRAGYSFLQAVDMVVEETLPPMSIEFRRVLTEARLGLSLEDALDNMANRLQSTNFNWTIMAVKTQREVGGNLAEVLEILADTIRERDRVARQIKVLTAEGRLSAIILFLLPLALGVVLYFLNPSYVMTLFGHPLGWMMIVVTTILMIIGGVWLKKVITIEV